MPPHLAMPIHKNELTTANQWILNENVHTVDHVQLTWRKYTMLVLRYPDKIVCINIIAGVCIFRHQIITFADVKL